MDSIEKMRRINDLTRELKQRGFAESSFEAIQQANQIYGQEDVQENVKHGIISSSQNDRMGSNMAGETESLMLSASADRKISKLSENMDMLTNKMNEIIKAINDIDSRISDLKNKHESLSSKHESLALKHEASRQESSSKPEKSEIRSESSVSSQAAEKPHVKAEPASEANQRTGGFQSQDVSIDKMFYFGKK